MTISELRSLESRVDAGHYLSLREAADELLRAFVAISDWDALPAVRYRLARSEAPDFGDEE